MSAPAVVRYPTAAVIAAAVTFAVLFTMQWLVAGQRGELGEVTGGRVIDFVRLRRETAPEVKKRELPKRAGPPPKEAPPPDLKMAEAPRDTGLELAAAMPDFKAELDLASGPSTGGPAAGEDVDVVPLVRVNPQYPPRAMQRGVEGYVHVQFTITQAGTVKDVSVVRAEPETYFEDAAINAVKKYKYKPKLIDGAPVERPGVEVVLSFKLNS